MWVIVFQYLYWNLYCCVTGSAKQLISRFLVFGHFFFHIIKSIIYCNFGSCRRTLSLYIIKCIIYCKHTGWITSLLWCRFAVVYFFSGPSDCKSYLIPCWSSVSWFTCWFVTVNRQMLVRVCFSFPFSSTVLGQYLLILPPTIFEALSNWLSLLPALVNNHSGGDSLLIGISHNPLCPSPLISWFLFKAKQ